MEKRIVGPVTTGATLGAAVTTVIAWLVAMIFNIEMPEAVTGALAVVITAAGGLLGGYLVRPQTGMPRGTGKRRLEG